MTERRAIRHVELRAATASDIPALFSVRTSVRENHLTLEALAERGLTQDSTAMRLASGEWQAWVVEERSAVVAFSMADARSGTVFAVFVRPEAERRGYGRALLHAAEKWLFAAGWTTIRLQTSEESYTRAHRVYRAAGWELVGPADHGDVQYEKHRPI